jgi:hypothetical protein
MVKQSVVMDSVQAMKPMITALMIVFPLVNVQLAKLLTAMALMNAGQKAGLVMASQTVKINSMVQI